MLVTAAFKLTVYRDSIVKKNFIKAKNVSKLKRCLEKCSYLLQHQLCLLVFPDLRERLELQERILK